MISTEAEAVGKFVGDCISTPIVQAGTLLSVLSYMLYTEPLLGLVVLLIAAPQFFVVPIIQRRMNVQIRERARKLRQAGDLMVRNMQGNRGFDTSLKSEVGETFDTIYRVRLRVFKLKFGLEFLSVDYRRSGFSFYSLLAGSWFSKEEPKSVSLWLSSAGLIAFSTLGGADSFRAIDFRRKGPVRPDRGHPRQETVKSLLLATSPS